MYSLTFNHSTLKYFLQYIMNIQLSNTEDQEKSIMKYISPLTI